MANLYFTTFLLLFLLQFLTSINGRHSTPLKPSDRNRICSNKRNVPSDFDYLNNRGMVGSSKEKASSIALKAAQEAKAASNAQTAAGQQAAHQVKAQLAEKALQAARAAEAALAGKQEIVEQLEKEVHEAEAVVEEETASLLNSQNNVNDAMQESQQASSQLKTLTQAIQTLQANVGNSEQAVQGAQQVLEEKAQLLKAAKTRVEQLLRQLSEARSDFASTRQAAYKASAAAHEAKVNAARNRRRQRMSNAVKLRH